MTSNIRKALFKSLLVQTIENENTVIIDNGEEVRDEERGCVGWGWVGGWG